MHHLSISRHNSSLYRLHSSFSHSIHFCALCKKTVRFRLLLSIASLLFQSMSCKLRCYSPDQEWFISPSHETIVQTRFYNAGPFSRQTGAYHVLYSVRSDPDWRSGRRQSVLRDLTPSQAPQTAAQRWACLRSRCRPGPKPGRPLLEMYSVKGGFCHLIHNDWWLICGEWRTVKRRWLINIIVEDTITSWWTHSAEY